MLTTTKMQTMTRIPVLLPLSLFSLIFLCSALLFWVFLPPTLPPFVLLPVVLLSLVLLPPVPSFLVLLPLLLPSLILQTVVFLLFFFVLFFIFILLFFFVCLFFSFPTLLDSVESPTKISIITPTMLFPSIPFQYEFLELPCYH